MGANMGKSYNYNANYAMRRRTSSPAGLGPSSSSQNSPDNYNLYAFLFPAEFGVSENNNFSKEYWGPSGGGNGGDTNASAQAYWMVDNEKRYRQEVFQRNSSNFYQPPSNYRTTSSFDSPFSYTGTKSPLRRGQQSFDRPSVVPSTPIASHGPSMKPPTPKYVPAIGGRV